MEPLPWNLRCCIIKDRCLLWAAVFAFRQPPSCPPQHQLVRYRQNILNWIKSVMYCRSNILDKNWRGCLLDFGFSIQLPPRKANKTIVTALDALPGTDGYRPPEYSDGKFSTLSDIYCMGVVSLYNKIS